MNRITSRQNALVAQYREAARGGPGHALLIDGAHLIGEALTAGVILRHAMALDGPIPREIESLLSRLHQAGVPVALAAGRVMEAVSPVRTPSPIVALAEAPESPAERLFPGESAFVFVTIDVQDPGNLGAIVRVAEAAGATGLLSAGSSADPFGWKALRGSMGSAFRLPIRRDADCAAAVGLARARGCRTVAAVPRGGSPLFDAPLSGPIALLIGGEGAGLAPELVDAACQRVTIPMDPHVESLNAAVAAALLAYEVRRRRAGPPATA